MRFSVVTLANNSCRYSLKIFILLWWCHSMGLKAIKAFSMRNDFSYYLKLEWMPEVFPRLPKEQREAASLTFGGHSANTESPRGQGWVGVFTPCGFQAIMQVIRPPEPRIVHEGPSQFLCGISQPGPWLMSGIFKFSCSQQCSHLAVFNIKTLNSRGICTPMKLQYFGYLMWRVDSLEKTLMLGKAEGKRRKWWQRMRWGESITDSVDMRLSKLPGDSERQGSLACLKCTGVTTSQTRLSNWTTTFTVAKEGRKPSVDPQMNGPTECGVHTGDWFQDSQ